MARGAADAVGADPTEYPVEERVGEDFLQRLIVEQLRPLIERYLAARGVRAFTGADQFIYYVERSPVVRWAPDVYVVRGADPGLVPVSWKTWQDATPTWALEVASKQWQKDYQEAPASCAGAGVEELVVFDPEARREPRHRFQVYRRLKRRGFVRTEVTDGDRVRSRVLGCWLRAVGTGREVRLRLGTGPEGGVLFPTAEEAALAEKEQERATKEAALAAEARERAAKEAALAEKGQERAAKEQERAAKEAALARVAELEAALARGRRPRGAG